MSNEFDELLQALLNETPGDVEPQSRSEEILLSAIDNYGIGSLPKPASRLEAYLMALVGKMINASKNPDMNQNDPTVADYVKNRTHWAEIYSEQFSYDREVIDFSGIDIDSNGMATLQIGTKHSTSKLYDGDAVCVGWDHEVYTCVASVDNAVTTFGNRALVIEDAVDTGEPFYVCMSIDHSVITAKEPDINRAIYAYKPLEKVHTINPKYMPCDLMFKVGCGPFAHPLQNPGSMGKPVVVSGSLEAVIVKLKNGKIPVVKVQYQSYDDAMTFVSGFGGEFTCNTWVYGTYVIFYHDVYTRHGKITAEIGMATDDPEFIEMVMHCADIATSPLEIG